VTEPRYRVVIADDEPHARERIRMLLARHPEWHIAAECETGADAVEAIAREAPDLAILDIRMPDLNGIEVAEVLEARAAEGERVPVVVFATAYEDHAHRAFDVAAVDYVLKPIDPERLARALDRAKAALASDAAQEADTGTPAVLDPALRAFLAKLPGASTYPRRFLSRDARGAMTFVPASDIDWVEATGNYMTLHAGTSTHMVRDTMAAFMTKLDPESFVRIHRSTIVNLDRIARIEPAERGEYTVTLRDGTLLGTSHAFGEGLRRLVR
jgi:two-component system LytT family response regulator